MKKPEKKKLNQDDKVYDEYADGYNEGYIVGYNEGRASMEAYYKWKLRQKMNCQCVYESDCHGIEMIKAPSSEEWAIGGTSVKDRWKFCPWCGGSLPTGEND